jgi:hypothetical protein
MSILDEFDALFEKERSKFDELFAKKHKTMSDTSRVFYDSIKEFRKRGWEIHAEVWNIAFFLNMAAHDISVLVAQLAGEHEPWTRKLAARHLALAAYETVEDMMHLLGKPIREPLEKLGLLHTLDQQLRQARQPLDSYWQTYAPTLKAIRVASVAHREHDGVILFESIDGIDIQHIMELGLRLGDVHNQLGPHLQYILNKTATTPPPEMTRTKE